MVLRFRFLDFNFTQERYKVSAGGCLGDGDGPDGSLDWAMRNNLDFAKFGDGQTLTLGVKPKMLWNRAGLLGTFAFEFRKLPTLVEEVVIGSVEMTQGLLEGLRIGLMQPLIFWLFLELRQPQGGIVVVQALLFLALVCGVVVNPLTEKIVIDKATRAKLLGEFLPLRLGRVDSEFERLVDYHSYNISRLLVIVKTAFIPPLKTAGFQPLKTIKNATHLRRCVARIFTHPNSAHSSHASG